MFNSVMESWTRFILLLLVIRLSDAEEEQNNLTGTEGGNITLPDPVLERGYLLYEGNVIAQVINRVLIIDDGIYISRLHWNNNSGLFTITDLQKRDSGIYKIDSKKGVISTKSIYSLTVYDSVALPAVQTLSVSSDSCYLLCAVDKAAEITLWWYKDEEVVNQSSSAGPLPLTVTKQDLSSSYRCVAGNPAEERTLLVDLQTFCGENFTAVQNNTESRHHWIIIAVSIGCVALAIVPLAFLIKWKCFKRNEWTATERQDPEGTKSDAEYTEVNICPDRRSQGGNLPDSPGSVDRSNLTTVYDKLEAHRMVLPDSDGNV
ncbi:uncharacterized protein LOC111576398 [Amphiprion ocellaris]|uniref:uncharacterized protein LOC111576398 n=1 Tax=Amphiprion ocellaris TaxID=80972 RepID=UPI002411259F|nr:uncharacterized protein LOC111576398 [Amphiprion ocellaris]